MVGYFYSGRTDFDRLVILILISVCLYSTGMILNDLCDLEEDRKDELDRPLVSGEISLGNARTTVAVLLIFALLLSFACGNTTFILVFLLALLIFFYNMKARKWKYLGFTVMGLLRYGNMMLGAVAVLPNLPTIIFMLAAIEAVYIFFLCVVARSERASAAKQAVVTGLIRGLIPLQILFLVVGGYFMPALVGVGLMLANTALVRKGYYAT